MSPRPPLPTPRASAASLATPCGLPRPDARDTVGGAPDDAPRRRDLFPTRQDGATPPPPSAVDPSARVPARAPRARFTTHQHADAGMTHDPLLSRYGPNTLPVERLL